MSIRTVPCEWPLIEGFPTPALDEIEEQDFRDSLIEAAQSFLNNWTGRVFGLCELSVRPCKRDCKPSTYFGFAGIPSPTFTNRPFLPVLIGGEFFNITCGKSGCKQTCGCGGKLNQTSEISLPGPIDSIVEVLVDGEVVPDDAYRVDNRFFLVRTDGDDWPTCQDLTLDVTEVGTFEVTYLRGTPVPPAGQLAAAILAEEFAKSTLGRDCELPQRVQSVTREGVTVAVLDSFEGLERGNTGIWLIDSFVTSVTNSPRRSRVLSPDTKADRVRTA